MGERYKIRKYRENFPSGLNGERKVNLMKVKYIFNNKNAYQALWVNERYTVVQNNRFLSDGENKNITNWRKRKTIVSEEDFEKKLKLSGYEPAFFNEAIGPLDENHFKEYDKILSKSDWLQMFNEGINIIKEMHFDLDKLDFSFPVRSFILWGKEKLEFLIKNSQTLVSPEVIEELLITLGKELLSIANQSLVLELNIAKLENSLSGATPHERFQSFIKNKFLQIEHLVNFYEEYATLGRLLSIKTINFVNNISEAINRLEENRDSIEVKFDISTQDQIISVSPGAGDTHQQGRTVIKFSFKSGEKLIYKPRNLEVARIYNDLIYLLNQKKEMLFMPTYKLLCCEEYTFEEFISEESCESVQDAENFYIRFGQLIGIMYALRGGDFHFENLIAKKDMPYIIDLETMFQNSPMLQFDESADIQAKYKQIDSVLFTSLLPQDMFKNKDNETADLSALNGKEQKLPFNILKPVNEFTDEMHYDYEQATITGANNLPKLNDEILNYKHYVNHILKGFKAACNIFVAHRKEILSFLPRFKNAKIRIILKGTQRYGNMIDSGHHPDYTRDALWRETLLETIWAYPYRDKRVIKYEIQDLLEDDIPIFFNYPSSRDLITSKGEVIDNFFEISNYDRTYSRIKHLNADEIEEQTSWIIVSLGAYEKFSKNKTDIPPVLYNQLPPSNSTNEEFIQESVKIGNHILERAIYGTNKSLTWLDVRPQSNDKWTIEPLNGDLYDGLGGLALYFHFLHKVTGKNQFENIAKKLISSAVKKNLSSKGISAFLGTGSIITPLLTIMKDDNSPEYVEWLTSTVEFLKSKIDKSEQFDYLTGTCGIVKNLLNVYYYSGLSEHLSLAEKYGDLLLYQIKQTHQELLGGLSHGASGLSLVLYQLGEATSRLDFQREGERLLKYDRSLFSPTLGAWKDLRIEEQPCLSQWCHGTVGIGLSRLALNNIITDTEIQGELKAAVNFTLNSLYKSDDCLCHGNMGTTELLLSMAIQNGNMEFEGLARQIATSVIESSKNSQGYHVRAVPGFQSIGLFTGISGIGYQLLRLARPDIVPSILSLDLLDKKVATR